MEDQKRRPHAGECFTCSGCGKAVRQRRAANPTQQRCLCCSFLDTVHDVQMREALRRVLNRAGASSPGFAPPAPRQPGQWPLNR